MSVGVDSLDPVLDEAGAEVRCDRRQLAMLGRLGGEGLLDDQRLVDEVRAGRDHRQLARCRRRGGAARSAIRARRSRRRRSAPGPDRCRRRRDSSLPNHPPSDTLTRNRGDYGAEMSGLVQVEVAPEPVERFRDLLGPDYAEVEAGASQARDFFAGRVIWQVNSTARGGGVAEMLRSHLAYVRAVGIDVRWVLAGGGADFFAVTKRIHNNLHGSGGDGGELGPPERAGYERGLKETVSRARSGGQPGDIAFLHDPQTLGLIGPMREVGAHVLWRCHIGVDEPNEIVRRAWRFLDPYVSQAHACIFSREQYVWDDVDPAKVTIVPPSIDPFSPKNQELAPRGGGGDPRRGRGRSGRTCRPLGVQAKRRHARACRSPRRDDPGIPGAGRRAAGLAGLALGHAEGPDRPDRLLRRARPRPGRAPAARGARRQGGRRRSRGRGCPRAR